MKDILIEVVSTVIALALGVIVLFKLGKKQYVTPPQWI